MAAMFERGPSIAISTAHVNSTTTIRQLPLTYNHSTNPYYTSRSPYGSQTPFLQDTMRITTSDWMYSALDQLTLNARQPDWSQDGWAFTPVNLGSFPSVRNYSTSTTVQKQGEANSLLISHTNVTLETSALRGRLQCSKIETKSPSWFTVNEVDLFLGDNSTEAKEVKDRLNRTGYVLPKTVFNNTDHETSMFSRTSSIQCCSNETDPDGRAAVGYWSQINTTAWWGFEGTLGNSAWVDYGPEIWPPNFAVKWIVGPTTTSNVTAYSDGVPSKYKIMQFKEVPPMTFLDCKPIIEKADAKIVLAHGTEQVLDFEILGEPQAQTEPWTAHFRHKNESNRTDTVATVR